MSEGVQTVRPVIGIVGLGLIGGSMAKAFKKYTGYAVCGCDCDESVLSSALAAGAVDIAAAGCDLKACDVVLIALYPQQAVNFVKQNIDQFKSGAILTDFCGVKRYPVSQLTGFCAERGITFVGGHPMAGRECWGFSGSDADLFLGASMILTPGEGQSQQEAAAFLSGLFMKIGFAAVNITTPEAHDSMIAFTSQLAHVVSSAYIKSPRAQLHKGFSAGSYKDLTRVAKLNAPMWTELFLENADDLVCEIDTIIAHLNEYRDAVSDSDGERLCALLEDGRKRKEALE